MTEPNKTQGGDGFLPDSRGHRYGDQLRFIARFPAYTTVDQPQGLTWWYRQGDDVASLDLRWAPGKGGGVSGVSVSGDVAWGSWIMRRDIDPLPEGAVVAGMPEPHRQLFDRYGGIRPVVFPDPFEGLAWAILGQQISVAFAAQLKNAVAERYGTMVEDGGRRLSVFPSASVLSRVTADELRGMKLSRQKAETLIAVAQAADDGTWDLQELYSKPSQEAYKALVRIKGIGPWTAEYCLLRAFGHPDILPAGDVALRRSWARASEKALVSESELRQAGEVWRGMRSDFAFWLWLDNLSRRHARIFEISQPERMDNGDGGTDFA